MSSTRLVFKKNSSKAVSDLLRQSILEIVANPVIDQGAHKWVICSFMVEMFIKYTEDMVKELVLKDLLGPSYHGEVKYLQFLDKPEGGKKCQPSTGRLHSVILSSFHALPG